MAANQDTPELSDLDDLTRFVHLGLAVLGILAWATGLLAGDYKRAHHLGFSLHRWLGISASLFVFFRVWLGFYGAREVQFRQWLPVTGERLNLALQDLGTLLRFKLPERPTHQGLAAIVQAFGLAIFTWMAATGSLLFFFMSPGRKVGGVLHEIKEMHEVGLWLILIFLGLHVSAVTLHALAGDHLWKRTFFLEK
jgi:cytochrome b561